MRCHTCHGNDTSCGVVVGSDSEMPLTGRDHCVGVGVSAGVEPEMSGVPRSAVKDPCVVTSSSDLGLRSAGAKGPPRGVEEMVFQLESRGVCGMKSS